MCGFFFFNDLNFQAVLPVLWKYEKEANETEDWDTGYTHVYHSKILAFWIKAKGKTGFIFVIIDIGSRHA